MRSDRRFTDSGNAINSCCERRLPTPSQHPAILKMSSAISLPCWRGKDTNYVKAGHELHELSRNFGRQPRSMNSEIAASVRVGLVKSCLMSELLYKQEVFQLVGLCVEIHRE